MTPQESEGRDLVKQLFSTQHQRVRKDITCAEYYLYTSLHPNMRCSSTMKVMTLQFVSHETPSKQFLPGNHSKFESSVQPKTLLNTKHPYPHQ